MNLIPYGLYPFLVRPLLFLSQPENAHGMTIAAGKLFSQEPFLSFVGQNVAYRPVEVMGLKFNNPLGLAAGLDKNGEAIDYFGALGFGHIEVGTVTPKPQDGNPKPRMFRIVDANGIINRMGFNNKGVDYLVEKIKRRTYKGVLGVSIGKNETTPIENAVDDYLVCMRKVYPFTDYIAVNVSCPNTPDLTSLQNEENLIRLLQPLKAEQAVLADKFNKYVPLVVKLSPDLTASDLKSLCKVCLDLKIDAISCTNTTTSRQMVHDLPHAQEWGGLSGEPLRAQSTRVLADVKKIVKNQIPLIGLGGVSGVISAREKLEAGASLIQIYSALVYQGPAVIKNIVNNI